MKYKIWQLGNGVWAVSKTNVLVGEKWGNYRPLKPKNYSEHSSWQAAINWVKVLTTGSSWERKTI